MTERIRIHTVDTIAEVVLSRPEKHNGMDFAMLDAMLAAQKRVRRMRGVRAVLLHGEGPSFCSGLDIKSVTSRPAQSALRVMQLLLPWTNDFQEWSVGWRHVGLPVIAAIHGNCFGAGLQLALGADIRFCHPDARLSLMEAKWGLIPDMGGGMLLREVLPLDVAKELAMTARVLTGTEAKALGLVTHLAEDPLTAARELAAEIAVRSPDAVAAGKFMLQDAWRAGDFGALRAERLWQRRIIGRANQRISLSRGKQEGADAPQFRNRQW